MGEVVSARRLLPLLMLVGALVFAPSAAADSIDYEVEAGSAYTVEKQGDGVVQVTYERCLVAGVRNVLGFTVVTEVSRDGEATFEVLKEEGESPQAVFDPSSLFLRAGEQQRSEVRLSFTLSEPTNAETIFRFKLKPDPGQGIGESAGVLVKVPCVVPRSQIAPAREAGGSAPCIVILRRKGARAGQPHVIRVGVMHGERSVQGARVRLRGAGVRAAQRTGGPGTATFKVRPRRAGIIVVQTDVCEGASRLQVRAARVRPTVIRFAG